jgi:hypothetical protein
MIIPDKDALLEEWAKVPTVKRNWLYDTGLMQKTAARNYVLLGTAS